MISFYLSMIVYFFASFKLLLIRFRFASFWVKAIWIGWSVFIYGLIEVNWNQYNRSHENIEKKKERRATHTEWERESGRSAHMWTIWGYQMLLCFLFSILILGRTAAIRKRKKSFINSSKVDSTSDSIFSFIYLFRFA